MIYKSNDPDQPRTWGLVTTCREPTQLMIAFVAHHLAAGASRIYLYLDAPQPDLESLLAQIPQVDVTLCDRTYWRDHIGRRRPGRQELRQLINAYDAYARTDLAWLAHIDADEFLHSDLPLSEILAAQPDGLDYATVTVRERAFLREDPQRGIFDGVFRRPLSKEWENPSILLRDVDDFMRRGVLGYPHGKSFMRTGQWLVPGIHTPRRQREKRDIPINGWPIHRVRLLHFDGLTALHWGAKMLRSAAAGAHEFKTSRGRVPEPQRANQIREVLGFGGDLEKVYAMHKRLRTISVSEADRLRALGVIEDHAIDPARDIAALGLDETVDLSRQAFDRALAAQQPQVGDWLEGWERVLRADADGAPPPAQKGD